jgi:hypothetical protein
MSHTLQQEILHRARALLDDPRRWTRRAAARDAQGLNCQATDERAVRFCAYGALLRAAFDVTGDAGQAAMLARAAEMSIMPDRRIALVNDRVSHRAVLRLIDQALLPSASPL